MIDDCGFVLGHREKTPLRIALMIYGDICQKSGGFLYDRELTRGLQELGCEVDVLSMPWPSKLGAKAKMSSSISLLKSNSRSYVEIDDVQTWDRTWTAPYDVLLQDELCHQVLTTFNQQQRLYPSKVVAIVHNLAYRSCDRAEKDEVFRREKEYLEGVDGVITNSYFTFRTVEEILRSDIPAIVAYPSLGIDPKSWPLLLNSDTENVGSSQRQTLKPIKFISVGNITRVKQFHCLLEALGVLSNELKMDRGEDIRSSCRPRPWSLSIVGDVVRDPSYVKQIEEVIDRYDMHEQVEFTGHLEGRALANAYREADVMVLATREEGFGIACLEAMAFGLPTIASREGAASEIVSDGVDGILFDPNRKNGSDSLLEALRMWIPSTPSSIRCIAKRLKEFGHNAERNARRFSGWSRTASDVFDFLVRVRNSKKF